MYLTTEQATKLTEMAFAEKSNKEIAETLDIKLTDVHAARSRLGITIPKVKEALQRGLKASTSRNREEIDQEMAKVLKAKEAANKKIARCDERLVELSEELQQVNKAGGR